MTPGPRISSSRVSRKAGAASLAAFLVVSVGFATLSSPAAAYPADSSAAPVTATGSDAPDNAVMGSYAEKSFRAEAKELPSDLLDALERDVSVTGAEYLANAAAAADATDVLAALEHNGVAIEGSHLDGTTLVVNVDSEADADAVTAAGAVPDFAEPEVVDLGDLEPRFLTDNRVDPNISGGEAFAETRYGFRCSIGFSGYNKSTSSKQLLTAGHCKEAKTTSYKFLPQTEASSGTRAFGNAWRKLGSPVSGSFTFGSGNDAGLIALTSGFFVATPTVSTWNGAAGEADDTIDVLDSTPAVNKALICKSGATSGWSCGHVLQVDRRVLVEGKYVNSIVTDVCTLSGDSGGSVLIGNSAVGIVSWGTASGSCVDDDIAGFFPLVSVKKNNATNQSVAKRLTRWEPMVKVATPVLAAPATDTTIEYAAVVSGTLPAGTNRHKIVLYVDGKRTALSTKVKQNGTWSTRLVGVKPGAHTLSVRGLWGTRSWGSNSGRISFTVAPIPALLASAAADPYGTSASDSAAAFPAGSVRAYVTLDSSASGIYAAAAAGAKGNGPVLLTSSRSIPSAVVAELKRLDPARITVAGGTGALSASALATLKEISPVSIRTNAQLMVYARE